MGNAIAAAEAATKSSGSALTFPILIVLVFVGFYFLMIRPQRRRQQQVAKQQNTVSPGARVRTTAGMYATVTAVDGDDVVLEVAPGIEVRYLKRAIMEVIAPGEDDETYTDGEAEPFDETELLPTTTPRTTRLQEPMRVPTTLSQRKTVSWTLTTIWPSPTRTTELAGRHEGSRGTTDLRQAGKWQPHQEPSRIRDGRSRFCSCSSWPCCSASSAESCSARPSGRSSSRSDSALTCPAGPR